MKPYDFLFLHSAPAKARAKVPGGRETFDPGRGILLASCLPHRRWATLRDIQPRVGSA